MKTGLKEGGSEDVALISTISTYERGFCGFGLIACGQVEACSTLNGSEIHRHRGRASDETAVFKITIPCLFRQAHPQWSWIWTDKSDCFSNGLEPNV